MVTVVRNDAAGLLRTVASVAAQEVAGVEHLIVDGASTDGTTEAAHEAVAGDATKRLISQPDDGIYDAMNTGWREATGTAVHFLNAGDVYRTPDALPLVQARWVEPRRWLRTRVRFVTADGSPTRPVASGRFSPRLFWWGWQPVAHQGAFMARELLAELGGFRTQYRIVADHDLMRRAAEAGVRPQVWDRVTVDVEAGGVSTVAYQQGFREMHHARSHARSWPLRAVSAADAAVHVSTVATKRSLRWTAEQAVGRERVRRLRAD